MDVADWYTQIATHLARVAAGSDTNTEANHWWAESDRFGDLADLARYDPQAARAAYRPARAYQPTT